MENENLKLQYFQHHIEKGIRDIFEAQELIATKRIYQKGDSRRLVRLKGPTISGRSGLLLYALRNPEYKITPSGDGLIANSIIPKYIRFLDMKKHGNYMIYNRQVWGLLYSETRRNIKYEYRSWLENKFKSSLEEFNDNFKY